MTVPSLEVRYAELHAQLIIVQAVVAHLAAKLPPQDRDGLLENLLTQSARLEKEAADLTGGSAVLSIELERAARSMVTQVMNYRDRPKKG